MFHLVSEGGGENYFSDAMKEWKTFLLYIYKRLFEQNEIKDVQKKLYKHFLIFLQFFGK